MHRPAEAPTYPRPTIRRHRLDLTAKTFTVVGYGTDAYITGSAASPKAITAYDRPTADLSAPNKPTRIRAERRLQTCDVDSRHNAGLSSRSLDATRWSSQV